MIIVIDVGNTNITFGIYDGEALVGTFRMITKQLRTSDEYGVEISYLLERNNIRISDVKGAIIASVVPNVMHSLSGAVKRYLNLNPLVVGPGIKTGIRIATANPAEVGAYVKYGGPVLVIDFGTATTYDLISEDGVFSVGITAPGIRISAKALWEDTAKLPEIEIVKPKTILATDTITSMQAGLVYGQIGQTEYIINQVRKESGLTNMKVVSTGGLGSIVSGETKLIDVYDRQLTLDGLRLIYEKNRG